MENKRKRILSREEGPPTPDSEDRSPLLRSAEFPTKLEHQNWQRYGTLSSSEWSGENGSHSLRSGGTVSTLAPKNPVCLSWEDLNVYVPPGDTDLFSMCRKKETEVEGSVKGMKQVLFQLSGSAKPGQLIAVMGLR